jgi:hypothetical protein
MFETGILIRSRNRFRQEKSLTTFREPFALDNRLEAHPPRRFTTPRLGARAKAALLNAINRIDPDPTHSELRVRSSVDESSKKEGDPRNVS